MIKEKPKLRPVRNMEVLQGAVIASVVFAIFHFRRLSTNPISWLAPILAGSIFSLATHAYYRRYGYTGNDGGNDYILIGLFSSLVVYIILLLVIR